MSLPLSVCLTVCDEAILLEPHLRALSSWGAELVVVVTDNSSDQSWEIARAQAHRCSLFPWQGRLCEARNHALQLATQPWILVLDGDELVDARDLPLLQQEMAAAEFAGYTVPIRNYSRTLNLLHNWQPNRGDYPAMEARSRCPGYWNTGVLRLFRNLEGLGYEATSSVHCSVRPALLDLGLAVGDSTACIHHFEYLKGGESFTLDKTRRRLQQELLSLEERPGDVRSLLNVARSWLAQGDDSLALDATLKALEVQPRRYEALLLAALACRFLQRGDEALGYLEVATDVEAGRADPWLLRGMILEEKGKHQEAEACLRTALALSPGHPLGHNSLGVVLEGMGRWDEARCHYDQALIHNPFLVETRYNLATLLEAQGLITEAMEQYQAGLELAPDDGDLRGRLEQLGALRRAD